MPAPDPLDLAERLFGADPPVLPGRWRNNYGTPLFVPDPGCWERRCGAARWTRPRACAPPTTTARSATMPDVPQEPMTLLAEGAAQQHEMFTAWVQVGFTEQQALYLLGCVLKAMLSPPASGGG